MKCIFLLFIIVLAKIAFAKGFMLAFILLSFWLKGKSIKKSAVEWNNYFLTLSESFLSKYIIILYCISTALSSYISYILFDVFGFNNPVFKTIILTVICVVFSGIRYRKKGNAVIKDAVYKIHKSSFKEITKERLEE